MEVASRYLPAGSRAGVGGDWFDVIPLSGSPGRAWWSATSSATASTPPPPWAGCAPPCAPSPTSTCRPTNCSPGSTTWSPASPPRGAARRRTGAGPRRARRHLPVRGLRPGLPALRAGPGRPPAARRCVTPTAPRSSWTSRRPAARAGRPALRGHRARPARGQPARPLHRRPDRVPRPRPRRRARPAAPGARRSPAASLEDAAATPCSTPCCPTGRADDVALLVARTRALGRRPGRHLGPARRPGRRRRARAGWPPASSTPGAWTRPASPPNWSSASWSPTPSATAQPPIQLRLIHDRTPHLRGLRRQQHRPAPAPRPHLRRGRPRPAARRPAHRALGHPPDPAGKTIWASSPSRPADPHADLAAVPPLNWIAQAYRASSKVNWEEFGRSRRPRTPPNCVQLG